VAEIAHSSQDMDLHDKKQRYAAAGVREYLVVCLKPKKLHWFDLRNNCELASDAGGIFRSVLFPGLWIDGEALLRLDYQRLMGALNQGLATPEYAAFVANSRHRKSRHPPGPDHSRGKGVLCQVRKV